MREKDQKGKERRQESPRPSGHPGKKKLRRGGGRRGVRRKGGTGGASMMRKETAPQTRKTGRARAAQPARTKGRDQGDLARDRTGQDQRKPLRARGRQ